MLVSGVGSQERSVGIRTNDPQIIQGLRDRFDDPLWHELEQLDKTQTVGSSQYDIKVTEITVVSNQPDSSYENFDIELDADENLDANEGAGAISAEEFLSRYNLEERDFTGINLARVDLTGKTLSGNALNLSGANLTKARLENTTLDCVNLAGANLKNANLAQAQLHQTILTEANLENANLRQANLYETELGKANLKNANLSEVNLSLQVGVDLDGANLSGANLSKVNLSRTNFVGVNLSYANLNNANLLATNLESTNLQQVKLHQAVYNNLTIFPIGFNPTNTGAYLIAPNAFLQNVKNRLQANRASNTVHFIATCYL